MAEKIPVLEQRTARVAVSFAAVAVSVVTLIWWALRAVSMLRTGGRYDFSTYYAAGWALRHDLHANIYDAQVLAHAGAATHTLVNPPLPYTYPPLFAILLSPFTVIPFKPLAAMWQVMNDLLWLAVALVLAHEIAVLLRGRIRLHVASSAQRRTIGDLLADPLPFVALALSLVLCLSAEPATQIVLTGQINLLVLLPLALVLELERRGHPRWAGAMIAIAAMLKFTPAVLLLYFVLRRHWQMVLAGVAVLAALAFFCMVVVGPGVALASVGQALNVGTSDASLGHNEALLAPLLAALTQANPGATPLLRGLEYAVLALLALGVGYLIWRSWRPVGEVRGDREKDAAGYGMALCLMVILWPTVWVHHYVWALPAAAVAVALAVICIVSVQRHRGATWIVFPLLTALCCYLLVVTLPYGWDTSATSAATTYLGLPRALFLSFRALGTLVLLALLGYWYSTVSATTSRDARGILKSSGSGNT